MGDGFCWQGQRVLVTGGAGFIGSHLAERLFALGARITILDNLSTGKRTNLCRLGNAFVLREGDIRSDCWERILEDSDQDVIFHLAANAYVPPSVDGPAWDYQLNLESTFRLLEILRRTKWPGTLVYASSAAVYGNPFKIPMQESDMTFPVSPYGVSKLASERYVSVYSDLYGLKTVCLRLFSVFGPRQRKQIVYDFIRNLRRNPAQLHILGDGTQVRDFNYVSNVVDAALSVVENGRLAGEVYNVASGQAHSTLDLARVVSREMGVTPQLSFSGAIRPGDTNKWVADLTRLQSVGYKASVGLEEGIRLTLIWYDANPEDATCGAG